MKFTIRKFFALLVSVPMFLFLAWFFGSFIQVQGDGGTAFAAGFLIASAGAALYVYFWLARPGPLARFRNRGVDGVDRDGAIGMGMLGNSQHQNARRRRDETDGDDFSSRRSPGGGDEGDMDGDMGDGSIA